MILLVLVVAVGLLAGAGLFAYRSMPILSQPYRVNVRSDTTDSHAGRVEVFLVKRFVKGRYSWDRMPVRTVSLDDPEFDEKLVEAIFDAREKARRLSRAI